VAMEHERSRRLTVVGHYRVLKDVRGTLEDEAKTHNLSINALVSQVLSRHAHDEILFEEVGSVRMMKDTYQTMLGMLPEDKLGELGEIIAKTSSRAMMLEKNGAITIEAILDELCLRSRSGYFFMYEAKGTKKRTISLIHEMGPRSSVVLEAYVMSLFGMIGIRPKVSATDSSIVFEYATVS